MTDSTRTRIDALEGRLATLEREQTLEARVATLERQRDRLPLALVVLALALLLCTGGWLASRLLDFLLVR